MQYIVNIIESKLKNDIDMYDIFINIYNNYLSYNFYSYNECKNTLLFIYSIIFDINIDENKLTNKLKRNECRLNRDSQLKFRNKLIKRYKQCIIENISSDQCEAAHIVPLSDNFNYSADNGLLLSCNLHKLFDRYIWSINPNTLSIEVLKNNKQYSINKYNGNKLSRNLFNKNTINNLKIHYNKFNKKYKNV